MSRDSYLLLNKEGVLDRSKVAVSKAVLRVVDIVDQTRVKDTSSNKE